MISVEAGSLDYRGFNVSGQHVLVSLVCNNQCCHGDQTRAVVKTLALSSEGAVLAIFQSLLASALQEPARYISHGTVCTCVCGHVCMCVCALQIN